MECNGRLTSNYQPRYADVVALVAGSKEVLQELVVRIKEKSNAKKTIMKFQRRILTSDNGMANITVTERLLFSPTNRLTHLRSNEQ